MRERQATSSEFKKILFLREPKDNNFVRKKLGSIAKFAKGSQINGSDLSDDFAYPFLNGGVRPSGRWKAFNVNEYTVTISEGGNSCGYVNFMQAPFWCGAHCYYLYDPKCDAKYLFYALKSQEQRLMRIRSGCCMPNIKKSDLAQFEINIEDDRNKQAQVVRKLDSISYVVEQRKAQLAQLQQLVKSRFVEMFGNPMNNSKKWERVRFDSICENLDGRRIPITSSDRKQGRYPYYGASGIVDYVDDYIFDEDVLLVSEDGANLKMRSSPIAFSVTGKCWVNNHAHVVRFKENATQKYVEHHIELSNIEDLLTGSTQPKLNQAKLNGMLIMMPPLALQREFAAFVAEVDKLAFAVRKSLETAEELHRQQLAEAFS